MLWIHLLDVLAQLRPLFPRKATFFIFVTAVFGLLTRSDLRGVTSIVRALSLKPAFYKSLLRLFRCPGVDAGFLADAWTKIVFRIFSHALVTVGGRVVVLADGLKVPKEGRRMPAVKSLHQESNNNSKPEWIMGHMFQSVAVVVEGIGRLFAVPLSSRIHEGLKASNRENKSLVDKLALEVCWLGIPRKFLFVADSYYCAGDLVKLLMSFGTHVISCARSNAVAFEQPDNSIRRRGRKAKYGTKVKLADLFGGPLVTSTVKAYGQEAVEVRYWKRDLIWKSVGQAVRFVGAVFPSGKRAILMCTDLTLSSEEIVEAYAMRMRIEQGFKVLVRNLGAYAYHFWTASMKKISRSSKGQHTHRESAEVRRKMFETFAACELFVMCGVIAQGLLQYLAVCYPAQVLQAATGWYRSQVAGVSPTEEITQDALRRALPQLRTMAPDPVGYTKFLDEKTDRGRLIASMCGEPMAA